MRRRQLLAPMSALGAIAILGACSGEAAPDDSVQSAHVEVGLYNLKGAQTGTCSGVLLSANRVLTAGHCAVSSARWKVTSPGAQTSAVSARAYAYDWKNMNGVAQPRLHDLAVLVLDSPIALREYPTVPAKPVGERASAMRAHRNAEGGFEMLAADLTSAKSLGFALHYAMKLGAGETLDTGGAIVTPDGRSVLGIVHGRGTTTGTLYATRTDPIATWITNRTTCSVTMAPVVTTVTTYGGSLDRDACAQDPVNVAKDAGRDTSSGNGNDAGSGSGDDSGSGGGSGGATGSGGSSGSGGGGADGSCSGGISICIGNCTGGSGSDGAAVGAGLPTGGGSRGSSPTSSDGVADPAVDHGRCNCSALYLPPLPPIK